MAEVDPFQVPIPNVPEMREYLMNLDRFLKQLWERTGGGDDFIEKNKIQTSFPDKPHTHQISDIECFHFGIGEPDARDGADGEFYFRKDGGALTTIYQKRIGVWEGVV